MQLNLSLTLKGWVALLLKSCLLVHSSLAPCRYPAAGERDAGAASVVRHGKLPRGGQGAVTKASGPPGRHKHRWAFGESFSGVGGVLGSPYTAINPLSFL